jgi:hypothetical protein
MPATVPTVMSSAAPLVWRGASRRPPTDWATPAAAAAAVCKLLSEHVAKHVERVGGVEGRRHPSGANDYKRCDPSAFRADGQGVPYGKLVVHGPKLAAAVLCSAVGGRFGNGWMQPPGLAVVPVPGVPEELVKEPEAEVWLTAADEVSRSATHFDEPNSVLLLTAGEKRVWLAPPAIANSFPKCDVRGASSSKLAFDSEHAPEVAGASRHSLWQLVNLRQGDALYLPSGWWHQVVSEPGTVALSLPVKWAPSSSVGWHR